MRIDGEQELDFCRPCDAGVRGVCPPFAEPARDCAPCDPCDPARDCAPFDPVRDCAPCELTRTCEAAREPARACEAARTCDRPRDGARTCAGGGEAGLGGLTY